MPNPTAAMLVIGDEILSGRTRDANMYHLAGVLTEKGIDLAEVRVVADEGELSTQPGDAVVLLVDAAVDADDAPWDTGDGQAGTSVPGVA